MAVTDLDIVEGKHYHAWALMPSLHTFANGRTMTRLVYVASKQPLLCRNTARRHAKKMAEPIYGKSGYMALLCGGGVPWACPYTFEPRSQNVSKSPLVDVPELSAGVPTLAWE